ncbi:HS12A-like protein [Mya arenaria]|uniref:HS12A-like protein n=1 Tax=Mya arenaria TaxID=6604 RepID=A0ABY7FYC6_MYAAR|nr:HS12A-like protein [Mya arenaria]
MGRQICVICIEKNAMTSLFVVGIDFGTTYSGWSYSSKSDFDIDPTKVATKGWHGDQFDITRDMDIEDETGKKLKAKFVFMASIRFLRDDLLKVIDDRIKGDVKPDEICWVLTVPAIWDDGGTVDIAVQEVAENGSMKNIYKASGGDWGGTKVDDAYVKFLEDMLGKESFEEFKRSNMDDYIFMIREFELKKRSVDPVKSDKPIIFRVPFGLHAKNFRGKKIHEVIRDSPFGSTVSIKDDKLKVNVSVVTKCFKTQVDAIVDHVSNLIDQSTIDEIAAVVLVGGFSNCPILQQAMKTKLDNHTIIVPNDPDLAVLKGAVIFGHKPELISQRVSKYTYGIDTRAQFIEHVHRESYRVKNENGGFRCQHVFDKHITVGQCLIVGEAQAQKGYVPVKPSQTALNFDIY